MRIVNEPIKNLAALYNKRNKVIGSIKNETDKYMLAINERGRCKMINVLFLCVHNAGRSQMAEAVFNKLAPDGMRAFSAGTEPAEHVNPVVAQAMAEKGMDIAGRKPRLLDPEIADSSQRIISMGCGVKKTCPIYLGVKIEEDWELDDPAGKSIEEVRAIRDVIFERVEKLIGELKSE